jgi:hypothetical protein
MVLILGMMITGCGGASAEPTAPPPISDGSATLQPGQPTTTFSPLGTVPPELMPTDEPTLYAIPPEVLTTTELHERLDPFASQIYQLPCYGGLVPGEGGVQDVIAFYSQLGIAVVDLALGDFEDSRDGTGHMRATLLRTTDVLDSPEIGLSPPQVDVYLEEGTVQYMYVGWQYQPPYLTVERALNQLGQPDRIRVGVATQNQTPLYLMTFTYAENVEGSYSLAVAGALQGEGDRSICFTRETVGVLYLATFAPGQVPLEGLFQATLVPVEEGLSSTPQNVTTQASSGECLTMPAEQFEELLSG